MSRKCYECMVFIQQYLICIVYLISGMTNQRIKQLNKIICLKKYNRKKIENIIHLLSSCIKDADSK